MVEIGIIAAVRDEAEPLAQALNLAPQPITEGTYQLYASALGSIVLLTPGEDAAFVSSSGTPVGRPGKVSAGIATTILIERHKPDVLINAGTAAGIKAKGVAIGDIVVASHVANHDIHIPLPGYEEYGTRRIELPMQPILDRLLSTYRRGTVSSAESFTSTHAEWMTMLANQVIAKEMEAAGVMQAVQILGYRKPVFIIKALTNQESELSSGKEQTNDYAANFTIAMARLTAFVSELVEALRNAEHDPIAKRTGA